jgi:hypothetical protein
MTKRLKSYFLTCNGYVKPDKKRIKAVYHRQLKAAYKHWNYLVMVDAANRQTETRRYRKCLKELNKVSKLMLDEGIDTRDL